MEDYLATNIFARKKLRRVAHDFEHLHLLKKGDEALLAFLTAEPGYLNAACEAARREVRLARCLPRRRARHHTREARSPR